MTYKNTPTLAYQTASQMVSSLGAVVLLYDAMVKEIGAVRLAIEDNRIEERFNATQKACKIVLGLQSHLDFDKGGDMARMLNQFYNTLFNDVQRLNMTNSLAACDSVLSAIKEVRKSWQELAERERRGELKLAAEEARTAGGRSHAASNQQPGRPADSVILSV